MATLSELQNMIQTKEENLKSFEKRIERESDVEEIEALQERVERIQAELASLRQRESNLIEKIREKEAKAIVNIRRTARRLSYFY